MLNADKNLKLYYSISEVAEMLGVNESLLRYWEKEFPQLSPKKAGRGVRQYRKEDVETAKLIYHLVKERGMTLPGARQRMKDNKENTLRNYEIVERLKNIREELLAMRDALDAFTYDDLDALKENIGEMQASER
ncbi:MerR family transcriptional regulator [uncultured Mediterranea sp.]|uniref:MerR family transcriptional regulator n=1 Tax=uncultured Mediterranea sp. TaxID=1926662 RepID=UPI0027D97FFD|nr:MerR family transcriptional regulator [uncultured Mediterranea sp.]